MNRYTPLSLPIIGALMLLGPVSPAWAQQATSATSPAREAGETMAAPVQIGRTNTGSAAFPSPSTATAAATALKLDSIPQTDFEKYTGLRRLGLELLTQHTPGADSVLPPDDYLLGPGDEVIIQIAGTVDGEVRARIDRSGMIYVPKVGNVKLAGVRHAELKPTLQAAVGKLYKGFQLSASLGQLRTIRVFVTGSSRFTGSVQVGNLATAISAVVAAGGPSSAGSFRQVELRRGGKVIQTLDLYELLIKGTLVQDLSLQPDDIVHIPVAGAQVAIRGAVNRPAVIELKTGESIKDALQYAGGFTPTAERGRLALQRLSQRLEVGVQEVKWPAGENQPLETGDIVQVYSAVSAASSTQLQNRLVRVSGEVRHPGEYVLPAGASLEDAVKAAGGYTDNAYVYGAELARTTLRRKQEAAYNRVLQDLELNMAKNTGTMQTKDSADLALMQARQASESRLIERMRAQKPSGRLVLELPVESRQLPTIALEEGDELTIPARTPTVSVYGSVFNSGSYALSDKAGTLGDYLKKAGGVTKGADPAEVFVLRANGTVVSARQVRSGWFGGSAGFENLTVYPGDTIFVPEQMDKTTFWQLAKDWTQILYQAGLGVAALKTLKN